MSGRRDESLLLDDIVDASERLVELGARAAPGQLGADRDVNEMVLLNPRLREIRDTLRAEFDAQA